MEQQVVWGKNWSVLVKIIVGYDLVIDCNDDGSATPVPFVATPALLHRDGSLLVLEAVAKLAALYHGVPVSRSYKFCAV